MTFYIVRRTPAVYYQRHTTVTTTSLAAAFTSAPTTVVQDEAGGTARGPSESFSLPMTKVAGDGAVGKLRLHADDEQDSEFRDSDAFELPVTSFRVSDASDSPVSETRMCPSPSLRLRVSASAPESLHPILFCRIRVSPGTE